MNKIALRIDDIGASTKKFEVYSKLPFGNFLFLKYLYPFKAWAPYDEINYVKWNKIFDMLHKYNSKLTVGVTASWVDEKNNLIPFYEKFPKESKILYEAHKNKLIKIANHGLTHCVVGKHLPKLFTSNRNLHREFWDYLDTSVHHNHLQNSQNFFLDWIGEMPNLFIPPGNVYSIKTIESAKKHSIKYINSSKIIKNNLIKIINIDNVFAFHDKDLQEKNGLSWLSQVLKNYSSNHAFKFVQDLVNE